MSEKRILVIEDDADIWRSLEVLLKRFGYEVSSATDGESGLRIFQAEHPDLVILDLGLPLLDGWDVLERLRFQSTVPVLMLTARGLETDKVRGFVNGADDYITKPFNNDELVARVRAILRRSVKSKELESTFEDDRVQVDFLSHKVLVGGKTVKLTPVEFRLLAALVQHPNQIRSNKQLLEQAWHDPTGIGLGRVKFAVLSLRRKLGWTDLSLCPIETIRGFGYRYRQSTSEKL